jgi:TonB family protein
MPVVPCFFLGFLLFERDLRANAFRVCREGPVPTSRFCSGFKLSFRYGTTSCGLGCNVPCNQPGREYDPTSWKSSGLLMLRRIGCVVALLVAVVGIGHAQGDIGQEWRKQVGGRLSSNKGSAQTPLGQNGTAKVGFIVDRTGNLVSDWLEESTGIPALDQHALAVVEHSQPFPTPPAGLDDRKLRMTVEFTFVPRPPDMLTICRGC